MKATYDKEADAAYIYLKDRIEKGEIKSTISMNENIILDFDSEKKLIGIEILSASKVIPRGAVTSLQTA
ncbi:MAG TPA: DUF2283 domain-containing protein [archaeon]|nr:DUF2283 domain-containing protein [archaeon]